MRSANLRQAPYGSEEISKRRRAGSQKKSYKLIVEGYALTSTGKHKHQTVSCVDCLSATRCGHVKRSAERSGTYSRTSVGRDAIIAQSRKQKRISFH